MQVTKGGIKPGPQSEVESLLCMNRSKDQFILDPVAATANLRDLTRDIDAFVWWKAHETEFQSLNKALMKIFYFDTKTQMSQLLAPITETSLEPLDKEPPLML